MLSMTDLIRPLKSFLVGFVHCLSFHKAIHFLLNSPSAATEVAVSLATSVGLWVGSVFFHSQVIVPFLNIFGEYERKLQSDFEISAFHCIWIFPLYFICYSHSSKLSCNLGYTAFIFGKGSNIKKAVAQTNSFSTIIPSAAVWSLICTQIGLLYLFVYTFDFFVLEQIFPSKWLQLHSNVSIQVLVLLFSLPRHLTEVIRFAFLATIYGWCAIDPLW